jgi:NADPH:quinone reductase
MSPACLTVSGRRSDVLPKARSHTYSSAVSRGHGASARPRRRWLGRPPPPIEVGALMLAAVCHRYGEPEDLLIEEIDEPLPRAGHVVVEVHAAAVNFSDVLTIGDSYQVSTPLPFVPGSELAGVIVAVGSGVTDFTAGDRVFAITGLGAFAQRVEVAATSLERVPEGVGMESAAALGVAYLTSYHALRSVAGVVGGEQVVVLGAAGGVGLAAVEIGRALGATVIAAAAGKAKLDLCRKRGATQVIDYTREDLRARIGACTGTGADVVIDPVGGRYSEPALRGLRWGGRFVTLGYASGVIPAIPLNLVLLKGVVVQGMEIRTFGDHHPELARRDRHELLSLFANGRIDPHVGAVYPLVEAAKALRLLADRQALGKVVVVP